MIELYSEPAVRPQESLGTAAGPVAIHDPADRGNEAITTKPLRGPIRTIGRNRDRNRDRSRGRIRDRGRVRSRSPSRHNQAHAKARNPKLVRRGASSSKSRMSGTVPAGTAEHLDTPAREMDSHTRARDTPRRSPLRDRSLVPIPSDQFHHLLAWKHFLSIPVVHELSRSPRPPE